MRKYSVINYSEKQKEYFKFLINDFNFKLMEDKETDFDFITEYRKRGIRVHLDYDIRDNFFYFTLTGVSGINRDNFPYCAIGGASTLYNL